MFTDLQDGVAGIFQEMQDRYATAAGFEELNAFHNGVEDGGSVRSRQTGRRHGFKLSDPSSLSGFHMISIGMPNSAERKKYLREWAARADMAKIAERLRAGERPKMGGRGRPPARWLKVAAVLGIDLRAPADAAVSA